MGSAVSEQPRIAGALTSLTFLGAPTVRIPGLSLVRVQSGPIHDEVVYETGPRRAGTFGGPEQEQGRLAPALTCDFSRADEGIRTRDPHLGNSVADVSSVSAGLGSVPLSCTFLSLLSHESPQSLESTPFRW
jgi:hypothetical protein